MIRDLLLLPVRAALLPLRLARRVVRRAGRTLGVVAPEPPARPAPVTSPAPVPAWRPQVEEDDEPELELEPAAVLEWIGKGERVLLVDVREAEELARTGIVEGARHVPLGQLTGRVGELPRDGHLVFYCAAGMRSHGAATFLREQGHPDSWSVVGGLPNWLRAGGKVVPAT